MSSREDTNSLRRHPLGAHVNIGGGERRQITVLYYDLVQSFKLSNLIGDPEVFLEIVRSIHARFEVLLSRLGGTKYQTEGDGAWYLFGWPASRATKPRIPLTLRWPLCRPQGNSSYPFQLAGLYNFG